ncbi:MAG: sulfatase-like hydrolase/transferase [Candidatus Hydrogenedens sp.]|nr:sulfatase-like hydrolase/transferase [Candidatus Hydrogenedens sp.]
MHRIFLIAAVFFAAAAHAAPPNIVFILADDLGWTDLHCQGSEFYETPNLDKLAAEGMRFTRYYASPNCAPSRAALMSGQYAPRTGIYTVSESERGKAEDRKLEVPANVQELPLDRKTIANVLHDAGYATGMFGKWHLGNDGPYHPSQRGFDEALVSAGKHFNFVTVPQEDYKKGTYLADFLTDHAVDFIQRHKAEPFFLYLPHFAVHKPIDPKPEYAKAWKKKPPKGTHWNGDFAAMIQSVDESVGRILEALERTGTADNTLVIFTSDNGGLGGYYRTEPPSENRGVTDNAPLRGGKGTLYEGGVRVPFIVRWPGKVTPGATCDTPIAHIDMLPTLAAAGGAALPEQPLDGTDIAPLLRQSGNLAPRELYLHFPVYLESYVHDTGWRTAPASYIIDGDWKLLTFYETGRSELYHLGEDIAEKTDLFQAQPEIAARLEKDLAQWREDLHAAMPVKK